MTNPNNIHGLPGEDEEAGLEDLDACFVPEPKVDLLSWSQNIRARLDNFVSQYEGNHNLTEVEWLRVYSDWENEQD